MTTVRHILYRKRNSFKNKGHRIFKPFDKFIFLFPFVWASNKREAFHAPVSKRAFSIFFQRVRIGMLHPGFREL
jgi:hypothetical protein